MQESRTRRISILMVALIACCAMSNVTEAQQKPLSELAFQNSVNPVPPSWQKEKGPQFQLSHDYPSELPDGEAPWLDVDVNFNSQNPKWEDYAEYLQAILDYAKEGQLDDLGSLPPGGQPQDEKGWLTEVNGQTRWYHIPWMANNPYVGREFVHGCTNERTVPLDNFVGGHPLVDPKFESWAVGMYNPIGGYSIGLSFPKNGVPQVNGRIPKGLPFHEGTLVTKVLFTRATPKEVPFLEGSPVWTINGHVAPYKNPRKTQQVRLGQMDVAVVDHRSPMRWVFGTFVYNNKLGGDTVWDNLSPVGLQWGSDPWRFPAVPQKPGGPVVQSVLAPIDIYEHDGAFGRLAGPIDNPQSSCISCHQGAIAPSPVGTEFTKTNVPPIFNFPGIGTTYNEQNKIYFGNYPFPQAYPGYASNYVLDTSLQYQVAFQNYAEAFQSQKKKKGN